MKDHVHIRNAEAAHLARALARQTGKTISEVVLEALRQYRPVPPQAARQRQLARWLRLLQKDRAQGRRNSELPIGALYDQITGLPK
jgi:hypothetical protein